MCLMVRMVSSIFLLGYLLSPCSISSASTHFMTGEQMQTLETNLMILEDNNNRLREIWGEQEKELLRLKELSMNQSKQLTQLQMDLAGCKSNLMTAEKSLQTAQIELNNALGSCKKLKDREVRIKRQRNFWSVVAGGFAVGLIAAMAR